MKPNYVVIYEKPKRVPAVPESVHRCRIVKGSFVRLLSSDPGPSAGSVVMCEDCGKHWYVRYGSMMGKDPAYDRWAEVRWWNFVVLHRIRKGLN